MQTTGLTSPSNLERVPAAPLPFDRALGLVPVYSGCLCKQWPFSCVQGQMNLLMVPLNYCSSLPFAMGVVVPFVTMSLCLLLFSLWPFVVQKLFGQSSVLREELLYKQVLVWCVCGRHEFRVFLHCDLGPEAEVQ